MSKTQCPHCEGDNIVTNVRITQTSEPGKVGLKIKRSFFLLSGTEPLLADLCLDCGTVTRLHVQRTDRNWITAGS